MRGTIQRTALSRAIAQRHRVGSTVRKYVSAVSSMPAQRRGLDGTRAGSQCAVYGLSHVRQGHQSGARPSRELHVVDNAAGCWIPGPRQR